MIDTSNKSDSKGWSSVVLNPGFILICRNFIQGLMKTRGWLNERTIKIFFEDR